MNGGEGGWGERDKGGRDCEEGGEGSGSRRGYAHAPATAARSRRRGERGESGAELGLLRPDPADPGPVEAADRSHEVHATGGPARAAAAAAASVMGGHQRTTQNLPQPGPARPTPG